MSQLPDVSVIVPAFNAEATLSETLTSIRAQTHTALEIVVVDDGSSDQSPAIAERHASDDSRIRVVRQANGGVASARNRAIAETSAPFIAPIDADDLWHPAKIERQLTVFKSDARLGLVYSWYAMIDDKSRVIFLDSRSDAEGDVLTDMCRRNIVGNGSTPLMLRSAVEAAGGYDESLKARRSQGCEDYKLYFKIAQSWRFALVRDHLVGYRDLSHNMSSDYWQMLRSRDLCSQEFGQADPSLRPLLNRGRARLLRYMVSRSLRARQFGTAAGLFVEMVRTSPAGATEQLTSLLRDRVSARARLSDPRLGKPFLPNLAFGMVPHPEAGS